MQHDISNLQTVAGRTRTVQPHNRIASFYENQESRPLNRNALKQLHADPDQSISTTDLSNTAVAKGFRLASNGIQQSLSSGLNVLSSTSGGLLNLAKNNANNKNIKSIALGLIGSVFGLSSLKGLLGIPGILKSKDADGKQAPMLIKGAQWVAGGALAMGALRSFTGGVGMSNPAILVGIASFMVLRGIISAYENEHSPISKVLEILGIREKVIELTDDAKLDKLISN